MTHEAEQSSIVEQAARWWVNLSEGACSEAERQEFFEWVCRSPERIEAFIWIAMTDRALQSPHLRWPTTPANILAQDAVAERGTTIEGPWVSSTQLKAIPVSKPHGGFWYRHRRVATAIAALTLAAIIWTTNMLFSGPRGYDTGVGEQRSVLLSDGTVVTLNTRSRVSVRFSNDERRVTLENGEALFHVAKEHSRPFIVSVDEATIRAVGTEFNVRAREAADVITVIEGKVEIGDTIHDIPLHESGTPFAHATMLSAGEQAIVTGGRLRDRRQIDDLGRVTAWIQRQIIVDGQPLSELALEFNRYNQKRFVIADPDLAQRHISGVFAANDPDSLLDFLRGIPNVKVRALANGDLIVERSAKDAPPQP